MFLNCKQSSYLVTFLIYKKLLFSFLSNWFGINHCWKLKNKEFFYELVGCGRVMLILWLIVWKEWEWGGTIMITSLMLSITEKRHLKMDTKLWKFVFVECVTFSEKQEDYGVISWGIPPGTVRSCDYQVILLFMYHKLVLKVKFVSKVCLCL